MNRKITILHSVLFAASILILTASLVFYLAKWNSLPSEIGIHFDSDGQFDVNASKFYGFYPHIVSGILTAGLGFAVSLIQRKKTGLSISSQGELHFKAEFCLTLDCLSVLLNLFFANWSRCVSFQIPLNPEFMGNLELVMFAVIIIGIISEVITCKKYKIQQENAENSGTMHRLCRLIPWLLTVFAVLLLAFIWERLPAQEEFYQNTDYYGLAYFANFGTFLDKHFLLIPHVLIVILLTVLEILSVKAVKCNQNALLSLTDKLKLISGIFFCWWNFLLMQEIRIGMFSTGLFLVLCAVSFVTYFRKKNS